MAKFLNTSGVSYHLEELIRSTRNRLVLVSPYLQFNDRIREHIQALNVRKKEIQIVYRDNNLRADEKKWLSGQSGVKTFVCKNLHAKCYINDSEAIITSMNLYEFSQVNNNEMGVYITRANDVDLFKATAEEVDRLLIISKAVRLLDVPSESKTNISRQESSKLGLGFCIRTSVSVPFDIEKPLSKEAYKKWSKYGDPDYPEKFCHFSGEPSEGETTVRQPILKKHWKEAKETFNL